MDHRVGYNSRNNCPTSRGEVLPCVSDGGLENNGGVPPAMEGEGGREEKNGTAGGKGGAVGWASAEREVAVLVVKGESVGEGMAALGVVGEGSDVTRGAVGGEKDASNCRVCCIHSASSSIMKSGWGVREVAEEEEEEEGGERRSSWRQGKEEETPSSTWSRAGSACEGREVWELVGECTPGRGGGGLGLLVLALRGGGGGDCGVCRSIAVEAAAKGSKGGRRSPSRLPPHAGATGLAFGGGAPMAVGV